MIASGNKKEEYREIKSTWENRFIDQKKQTLFDAKGTEVAWKEYDIIHAFNGWAFSDKYPNIQWKHEGIRIGKPNPEWCEPEDVGKELFILQIGELLSPTIKRQVKQHKMKTADENSELTNSDIEVIKCVENLASQFKSPIEQLTEFRKLFDELINAGRDMADRDKLGLYYLHEDEYFDVVKKKYLKSELLTEQGKETAIEFAEWIKYNARYCEPDGWKDENGLGETKSTSELFELYLTSLNHKS